MNQSISLNINELYSFFDNMRDTLPMHDAKELALKSMALVELYPNADTNNLATLVGQAEQAYADIFTWQNRNLLSANLTPALNTLIGYLVQSVQKGLWTHHNKTEWVKYLLDNRTALMFDDSIYKLCQALFQNIAGDVYAPYDYQSYGAMQFSQSMSIFGENPDAHPIYKLMSVIFPNITHHTADPVLNPSYVADGKLQTFAKGFLAGAWGLKIDPKTFDDSRFAVGGNTYQNYLIQHLFAQVSDLALVFVPQNTLTSSVGADVELREWLINQKHLKAVISLPSGLLLNSGVICSLMIFELKNYYETVRLISLKDSDFIQKNHLVNIDKLTKIINGDDFNNAVNVHHHEIANKNFVLDPERYVLDDDSKKAVDILAKYQTIKLGEIADIIRPAPIAKFKDEGDEGVLEIQGGDLPSYGYIATASKQTFVSPKALRSITPSQVQAGDIIMTIRGSTGKVGLVSQALVDSSHLPMVVGQTGVIIRPNTDKINPIALYMQLHSKFAQSRLALLSVGSAIAGLSVKDLKEFNIAQLSQADEQMLIENFEKQCLINDEILQKQQMLAELSERFWL